VSAFASVSVSMNMCVCASVYVYVGKSMCVCDQVYACVCVCVIMPVTPPNCLNADCARVTDTSICAHTQILLAPEGASFMHGRPILFYGNAQVLGRQGCPQTFTFLHRINIHTEFCRPPRKLL